MSRISQLLKHVEQLNPQLAADLSREYTAFSGRRAFGLNFERHTPETVELPGRPIRVNDKVRFLPVRGEPLSSVDDRLWRVRKIARDGETRTATLLPVAVDTPDSPGSDTELEVAARDVKDLVVVAEFRDPIYPGLVSTGKVERGADKPCHTVINAENFHALQTLQYTHEGKVDVIYIDPPYNTGARDWKYNNDYVDEEDIYRHSKWLAFMERRLRVARRLLNPAGSVLVVTIDEKEYLRLGLLLEQTFPDARIQMISTVIKPGGVSRDGYFARSAEYLYFVMFGDIAPAPLALGEGWGGRAPSNGSDALYWNTLWRSGSSPLRQGHADTFYPIFINSESGLIARIGDPIGEGTDRHDTHPDPGTFVVWPMRNDGSEGRWQLGAPAARAAAERGYIKVGRPAGERTRLYYLARGEQRRIEDGTITITGHRSDGSVIGKLAAGARDFVPTEVWSLPSHDATRHGSILLNSLLPQRRFPYPKSLYAVEDVVRFFVATRPEAIVVDFFAGSGTTAHAVMRLNRQDGGSRQSISITNNEVSAEEQAALRAKGFRPGDPEWEALGICDYITKPRLRAAVEGETPEGNAVTGDYKFVDEFPIAEGLDENVEFFTLTYESPRLVSHNRAFAAIAPLLWLRAGAKGPRIDAEVEGYAVAETYGVLFDVDASRAFLEELAAKQDARIAYIVTDDDRAFQMVCAGLPEHIEPVRLYESYLTNFTINVGGENR